MIRTAIVAAGVTVGIVLTPGSAAANMCDKHGTGPGQIYIHACATGNGGAGPLVAVWHEETGNYRIMRQSAVADWKKKIEEERRRASAEDSSDPDTEN
ncbi:hypothetical protein [Mycobacterium sp. URHB0021]